MELFFARVRKELFQSLTKLKKENVMKKILRAIIAFIIKASAFKGVPLNEYRAAVTVLANENKNRRFIISSGEHANIVVHLMVSKLERSDEILIYSDCLSLDFYRKILIDSNCQIKIIFDKIEGMKIIESLPEDVQDRITCWCRPSSDIEKRHFIVAGTSFSYELEPWKDESFVVCNFYEPEIVERLKSRFERMWEGSVLCTNPF